MKQTFSLSDVTADGSAFLSSAWETTEGERKMAGQPACLQSANAPALRKLCLTNSPPACHGFGSLLQSGTAAITNLRFPMIVLLILKKASIISSYSLLFTNTSCTVLLLSFLMPCLNLLIPNLK